MLYWQHRTTLLQSLQTLSTLFGFSHCVGRTTKPIRVKALLAFAELKASRVPVANLMSCFGGNFFPSTSM